MVQSRTSWARCSDIFVGTFREENLNYTTLGLSVKAGNSRNDSFLMSALLQHNLIVAKLNLIMTSRSNK